MNQETKIDRVIWRRDLQETVQVSSETIRRWINSGKLPPPDVQCTRACRTEHYAALKKAAAKQRIRQPDGTFRWA